MRTALFLALTLGSTGTAYAAEWEVDTTNSTAGFGVRHMMVATVRGQFDKVTGTVNIDDKDLTKSTIDVAIDAASISTNDGKRDEHLRSADFFDTAKFPKITFKSKKIEKAGSKLKATGDLTMHGVTKPVTLEFDPPTAPVKSPWGQTVRGVSATGKLNRKDWGLVYNKALETGGVVIGDEVTLQIDVELVAKAPATAAAK